MQSRIQEAALEAIELIKTSSDKSYGCDKGQENLPVIDIGILNHPKTFKDPGVPYSDLEQEVTVEQIAFLRNQLHSACKDFGFFYVTNHGIPEEVLEDVMRASKLFHNTLTEEQKHAVGAEANIGYLPAADKKNNFDNIGETNKETQSGSVNTGLEMGETKTGIDLVNSFGIGLNVDPCDHGMKNRWPKELKADDFQRPVLKYQDAARQLSERLMKFIFETVVAKAVVEKAEEKVSSTVTLPFNWDPKPMNTMLLHKYPKLSGATYGLYDGGLNRGLKEHRDLSEITILLQDDVGGMEACDSAGNWSMASPLKMGASQSSTNRDCDTKKRKTGDSSSTALLVNVGDLLRQVTNGRYWSAPHRVSKPHKDEDRFSVVLFFVSHPEIVYKPELLFPDEERDEESMTPFVDCTGRENVVKRVEMVCLCHND